MASARLLLAALLLLAGLPRAWAHDPVIVDAEVVVDDAGRVAVTTRIRQNALLAALGSPRARFRDRGELERALPQVDALFAATLHLAADGAPLPLHDVAAAGAGLGDPLALTLRGQAPAGLRHLTLEFALGARLPGATTVIVGATLTWHGQPQPAKAAGSDGTVAWELAGDAAPAPARTGWAELPSFVRMGFLHIVPEGIDHILFVLGLFLLSPGLRPLLVQITAFTIAHSLTLGLTMAGVVELPARIVEPLIALSIVAVAVENLFTRGLHPWRWAVVFAFGLVHGLGFAGALRELHLPPGGILVPLLGFNLGVEAGQLTVVALAALATVAWWRRAWYPRYVIIPASGLIAAIGLFWAVQRGLGFGIEA